ncbi:MAG: lactamase [Nocardioidaceae bacterium]|jgi:flavorubredoxin|nr:lactamase [Nocardioidaceae bacterium]
MHDPFVGQPYQAARDVHVIPTYWPVPGMGTIAMNAFLLDAAEPVLVDTGVGVLSDDFLDALGSLLDPARLRWIWLTHEDRDHTGSLGQLIELAPRAEVVATFLTFGRSAPEAPIPMDRQRMLRPGDVLNVGDRNLRALRPPLFDSPGTLGFLDDSSGTLLSSDCFGAPLDFQSAVSGDADAVDPDQLHHAQVAWATADSPWVTLTAEDRLRGEIEAIRDLQPSGILSSHLPVVRKRVGPSLDSLLAARTADPQPAPTQAELEALLAEFAPAEPARD